MFATFALGTALGDFTASVLGLGYLASAIMFFFIILIPAVFWWRFGLNAVAAFWFAYLAVTRRDVQAPLASTDSRKGQEMTPDGPVRRGYR